MSACTYLLMFLLSFSHVCLCRNYLHLTSRDTLIFRGNPVISFNEHTHLQAVNRTLKPKI